MTEKMHQEFKKHRAKLAGQLIQGEDWPTAYRMADELLSSTSFEAGWLASRETLVVELPKYPDLEAHPVADIEYLKDVGYGYALAEARKAIHAAGIKTNP